MMTNTKREALTILTELCEHSPDVRLGQLMANLGMLSEDQTDRTLWDIDDKQLLAVLHHHRRELAERTPEPRVRPVELSRGGNSIGVSLDSPSTMET